jgi:hypothetical protein
MAEGQAVEPLAGDAVVNQSSNLDKTSKSSSGSDQPLEGAQQYTMKSMTLHNMNAENSSDNVTQSKENKSELASHPVAIGLYYQGGAVL